jgi:hypothetical protein
MATFAATFSAKAVLADAGSRGDQDELVRVQAAGHLVEAVVAGGQATLGRGDELGHALLRDDLRGALRALAVVCAQAEDGVARSGQDGGGALFLEHAPVDHVLAGEDDVALGGGSVL